MKESLLGSRKNYLIVGRAATGIWLILRSLGIKGKKVLYPANICYAAIYPAVYAENEPVFCDVDGVSGNLTLQLIRDRIEADKEIVVLVLPHMYGNPVQEIEAIKEFCRNRNVILIEDCASAMGAFVHGKRVGTFGDYVIYSTGYAKTIELGYGGIITSDYDLSDMERLYHELPLYSEISGYNQEFFSKLYRLIRNDKKQTLAPYLYQGFYANVKDMYVYQIDKEKEDEIKNALPQLEALVAIRQKNRKLYDELLKETECMKRYRFAEGAVPWRYNLLVSEKRKELIDYILERKLPVSDWYPDVTEIFGKRGTFANTRRMEEQIINFPLSVEQEKIQKICNTVNAFWEEKEV